MATFTYDHIHLRSPDPEATAHWYERMLGAQVIPHHCLYPLRHELVSAE